MVDYLTFCGDVWLPGNTNALFPENLCEGLVINLEGPITSFRHDAKNKICIASDKDAFIKAFPRLPLTACLANNHILDHGVHGFNDTMAVLDELGICHYGAGSLREHCNNPLIIQVDGIRVGLMGYVCASTHPIFAAASFPGVAPIDIDLMRDDIEAARLQDAERIIVSLHWGAEEVNLPKPSDVMVMQSLFNLGVDLVIGHHSHCLQPVLEENGQFGFFSLGNALFPDLDYESPEGVVSWKRNRFWNQTAAIISYVPKSGAVSGNIHRQRKGSLQLRHRNLRKMTLWNSYPTDFKVYEAKYRRATKYAHLRTAISRFMARPHLPHLRTLRSIARELSK